MKKSLISIIIIIGLMPFIYAQGYIMVKPYLKTNFVFTSGYWIYKDTVTYELDTITLLNCTNSFISPNMGISDYQEYFFMEYHSSYTSADYNDFIITHYWKRNGGGVYGELGQPVMHLGQYDIEPSVGNGFNGYEIIKIDNMIIQGGFYHDVVLSRVYKAQQYQNEFEYDTDLYFAPGTGIVRKEYTDSTGIHHVWDLIEHQGAIYTGKDELISENVMLYPNPVSNTLNVQGENIEEIEIMNLNGEIISLTDKKEIDLSYLKSGVYFVRVRTNQNIFMYRIIKH